MSDLTSLKIGTVTGYANPKVFTDAKLKTVEVTKDLQNFQMLLNKRVDLVLSDKILGLHLLATEKKLAGGNLKVNWLNPSIEVKPEHVVFPRKNPRSAEFQAAFNKGYKVILDKGEVQRILKKHKLAR